MNIYKVYSHYGPGGRLCPCCGPAPRHRKKFDRQIKRREKQLAKREINEHIRNAI